MTEKKTKLYPHQQKVVDQLNELAKKGGKTVTLRSFGDLASLRPLLHDGEAQSKLVITTVKTRNSNTSGKFFYDPSTMTLSDEKKEG